MPYGREDTFIASMMILGVTATLGVAAFATGDATGNRPDPHAWFLTLVIPVFLILSVTSYYSDKEPY
ncbi:MAG: hypothetical protein WCC92_14130 [Candidatus Korobacteraceae bacterium]